MNALDHRILRTLEIRMRKSEFPYDRYTVSIVTISVQHRGNPGANNHFHNCTEVVFSSSQTISECLGTNIWYLNMIFDFS